MKENSFKLTNERSTRYPAQTITDADYADDIVLLENEPAQVEILLHSLEWAAAGIGLHINAHKKEYMSFKQTGDISTLNGSSLKLVDKFTYLENVWRNIWRQLHKNSASNIEHVLEAAAVLPLTTYHESYPSQMNQTCKTLLEK